MQRVLVTGSRGFIGRNLISSLKLQSDIDLLFFDVENDPRELEGLLKAADVVFHLAGVNRPKDPAEYDSGNTGLTHTICENLMTIGRKTTVVLSSSIQADLDNPYGLSKRRAETEVRNYGAKTGADIAIYRLPNVFGKWCRPNYNSVVATFCYNLAKGLEIKVNDPEKMMRLVYIDDVVDEFMKALAGNPTRQDKFCIVPVSYEVKLEQIVELLNTFKLSRETLQIPNQSDSFIKKLYATFLSYLPIDKLSYPLKMNVDSRGSFTEFIKTSDRGQVSVNISKAGITKGNHWHHTKNEKFLVVSGRGVIRFRQPGETVIIEYNVSGEKLEVVDIPPGYTHNIENFGDSDMVTLMWASEPFDPAHPDTFPEVV